MWYISRKKGIIILIHNFIDVTNKMQKVRLIKRKNEWHTDSWNFYERGYKLLSLMNENEWKIHSWINNKPGNIVILIDPRIWIGEKDVRTAMYTRNDCENDSRKCGTIRTTGPFHRRFSLVSTCGCVLPACQQSPSLPLPSPFTVCAYCVVQGRKLPAFLTPASCETRDSAEGLLLGTIEFVTKEQGDNPRTSDAYHVVPLEGTPPTQNFGSCLEEHRYSPSLGMTVEVNLFSFFINI